MTTPGEGNGVEIPVHAFIEGDAGVLASELGQEVVQGLRAALAGAAMELPPVNAEAMLSSLDAMAREFQARIRELGATPITPRIENLQSMAREAQSIAGQVRTQQRAFLEASPAGAASSTAAAAPVQAARAVTQATAEVSTAVGRLAAHMKSVVAGLPRLEQDYGVGQTVSTAERIGVAADPKARYSGQAAALSPAGDEVLLMDRVGVVLDRFSIDVASSGEAAVKVAEAQQMLATQTGELAAQQRALAGGSSGGGGRRRAGQIAGDDSNPDRGFLGNVFQGFRGAKPGQSAFGEGGEFLGAIARYQLAYNVIYRVGDVLHQMLSTEEEVQNATVDLATSFEATGSSLDRANRNAQTYADSLARIATQAGLTAAQGIAAGAQGVLTFGGQIRGGQVGAGQVATASATAATRLAVITDGQGKQQDLTAATLAFNLAATDQTRVLDAATSAWKRYGGSIDEIIQSLPSVAEAAHQSGLSIEQTSNLVALISQRTNQSGTAAGTQLTRILEQMQTPTFRGMEHGLGINAGASQGQQLEQLAQKWDRLGTAEQNAINKALTGSRGVNALTAILSAGPEAFTQGFDAAGAAEEEYFRKLGTLSGNIKQIAGEAKQFIADLGKSGALLPLEAAGGVIKPLLQGLDELVSGFNHLNRSTGEWAGRLVALAAAIAAARALLISMGMATKAEAAAEVEDAAATEANAVAKTRLSMSEAGVGGRMVGRLAGGESAVGLGFAAIPQWALVTAGIVAFTAALGAATHAADQLSQAHGKAQAAEDQARGARTPGQLASAASAVATALVDTEHARRGPFAHLLGEGQSGTDQATLRQQLSDIQTLIQLQQRGASFNQANPLRGTYFDPGVADVGQRLASGFLAMQSAGLPLVQSLALMTRQVAGLDSQATRAAYALAGMHLPGTGGGPVATIDPTVQARLAKDYSSVGHGVPDTVFRSQPVDPQGTTGRILHYIPFANEASGANISREVASADPRFRRDAAGIQRAITAEMHKLRLTDTSLVSPQQQADIAQAVANYIVPVNLIDRSAQHVRSEVAAGVRNNLAATLSPEKVGAFAGGGAIKTSADLQAFLYGPTDSSGKQDPTKSLQSFMQMATSQENLLNANDPKNGAIATQRQVANYLQGAVEAARRNGVDRQNPQLFAQLLNQADQAIQAAVQSRVTQLQAIATANSRRDRTPADAIRTQLQGTVAGARYEADRGDETDLQNTIGQMNTYQANQTQDYIKGRIRYLRTQLHSQGILTPKGRQDLQAELRNYQQSLQAFKYATPTDATAPAREQILEARLGSHADPQDAVQSAQIQVRIAQAQVRYARGQHDEQAYFQAEQQLHSARFSLVQSQVEHADAELEATQVPGSQVSAALTQIQEARVAMAAYEKGSTNWWHAVGQLNQAEYALSQAQAQYAQSAYLVTHDTTDPVNVAIAALDQAHRQLAIDRARLAQLRRQGVDPAEIRAQQQVITADIVAQRQAAAQVQSARFSQRFTDTQNAHQLLLISDQAYMNYLQAQDRSLRHQIAGMRVGSQGYRQAIDELTQIDQAIMAANSQLAGQFNLGNIRVPTVYQVRDSLAAQRAGLGYGPEPSTAQTITIEIADQTDGGIKLRGVLSDALGSATVVRTPVKPNKVPR